MDYPVKEYQIEDYYGDVKDILNGEVNVFQAIADDIENEYGMIMSQNSKWLDDLKNILGQLGR